MWTKLLALLMLLLLIPAFVGCEVDGDVDDDGASLKIETDD